jgi:uncharacterized OsmC-like protein
MQANSIRDSIASARRYLSQHPSECRYTDSAATAIVEKGLRCRVEGPAGAVLVTDMPTSVGGDGTAPSPGWVGRAALASCEATVIAMRAAELGIQLQRLEVSADSESDDRGLLAVDETVPAGPVSSRIRIRIDAKDATPGQLRELVEWAGNHSPVSDAIRRAVPLRVEIEVGDGTG